MLKKKSSIINCFDFQTFSKHNKKIPILTNNNVVPFGFDFTNTSMYAHSKEVELVSLLLIILIIIYIYDKTTMIE